MGEKNQNKIVIFSIVLGSIVFLTAILFLWVLSPKTPQTNIGASTTSAPSYSSSTPGTSGSVSKVPGEIKHEQELLTTDKLMSAFSDWSKTGFNKSPIMLEKTNEAILTIMPTNNNVEWVEVVALAPNKKADALNENELAPIKRLLITILPEWKEGERWVKDNLNNLPSSINKENWKIKLDYSAKTGLTIVARQNLQTSTGVTTPRAEKSDKKTSPKDFENMVIENGKPFILGASVEDNHGKAFSRSSAQFLAIWVSSAWYRMSEAEKKYFIKLHLNVLNEWKGTNDGIVCVFDNYLNEEVGSGNRFGVKVKK